MTFLYHGRRDAGMETARRMYEAIAVKTRSPWNPLPHQRRDRAAGVGRGFLLEHGPMGGSDGPGGEIADFTRSGLVEKMIRAAGKGAA